MSPPRTPTDDKLYNEWIAAVVRYQVSQIKLFTSGSNSALRGYVQAVEALRVAAERVKRTHLFYLVKADIDRVGLRAIVTNIN